MQGHSEKVGGHHPVMGVDVHLVEPTERLPGPYSREQQEIAEDHQSLDVVIEAPLQDFPQGLTEAVHVRLAVIEEGGEGSFGFETIDFGVLGHLQPVDPVDEFAPSDDLPDESLHGMQGRLAFPEG